MYPFFTPFFKSLTFLPLFFFQYFQTQISTFSQNFQLLTNLVQISHQNIFFQAQTFTQAFNSHAHALSIFNFLNNPFFQA